MWKVILQNIFNRRNRRFICKNKYRKVCYIDIRYKCKYDYNKNNPLIIVHIIRDSDIEFSHEIELNERAALFHNTNCIPMSRRKASEQRRERGAGSTWLQRRHFVSKKKCRRGLLGIHEASSSNMFLTAFAKARNTRGRGVSIESGGRKRTGVWVYVWVCVVVFVLKLPPPSWSLGCSRAVWKPSLPIFAEVKCLLRLL